MKQFEDMFFFKLRNLPVIFLQAGKTQEYEDFLLRAQKVKKASIEFFRSEMFSKNKCMDSILSRFKKLQKHGFIFLQARKAQTNAD